MNEQNLPHPYHLDIERRFGGVNRLYGTATLPYFQSARVAVIGIGGVGSWAVEALARSGIGHLTLVDLDNIAESNINRQIHALSATLGMPKVNAMQQRIQQISPMCQVSLVEDFLTPTNLAEILPHHHWVIDAIDQVSMKVALLAWCKQQQQAVVSSGAGGGKQDASRLRIADLADCSYDPLLARVRQQLRKRHHFAAQGKKMGVTCVYSAEPITRPDHCENNGLGCAGYGSSVAVTATMGMMAAGYVLQQLAKRPVSYSQHLNK